MIILYITLLKMVDKIRCSDIVSLLLSSYDDLASWALIDEEHSRMGKLWAFFFDFGQFIQEEHPRGAKVWYVL
jgi:hypothetical protein